MLIGIFIFLLVIHHLKSQEIHFEAVGGVLRVSTKHHTMRVSIRPVSHNYRIK